VSKVKEENEIDFVIAWVDGQDPLWRKEKERYLSEDQPRKRSLDQGEYRYRDWNLLRFWFRGVEKYAPWVRNIYFVTCGHIPQWLNTNHPKLRIVKHEDYIPKEYLPTFNSHTIELNFHRITGLAEQFVYFNDDMYITRNVRPEDFFQGGLPKDVFGLDAIYCAKGSAGSYNCNDLAVINDYFDKRKQFRENFRKWFCLCYGVRNLYQTVVLLPWRWFPGFYYQHLPSNFLKSTLEKVWMAAEEKLHETSLNKFRTGDQVNQWLFKYWQLANGTFVPQDVRKGHCFHIRDKNVNEVCDAIRKKRYELICINDTDQTTDFEKKKEEIRLAFEAVLPEKSKYER